MRTRPQVDRVALVGIGLSVLLSLALDVTSAATGVESLLAGLAGVTISLVLDATARAERRYELRRLLADPPWLSDVVVSAADSARLIARRYPGTVLEVEARRRLQRTAAGLAELTGGSVVRAHLDFQDLFEATRRCGRELQAVTNIRQEPTWWTDDPGRAYWRLNEEALARGVRITRVFVGDEPTDAVREVMRRQRQAGVQVLWAWAGRLPPPAELNLVVWDGTCAWRGQMSPRGDIAGNVFVVDPQGVDDLAQAFRLVAMTATPFEESP